MEEKIAAPDKRYQTVLLLDERHGQILPLSTFAFEHAQGSKAAIREKNVNAKVLYRDGRICQLVDIDFVELDGESVASRIFSLVTRSWRVRTVLSPPLDLSFDSIKQAVTALSLRDAELPSPYLDRKPNAGDLPRLISACQSATELFDLLGVPSAENALDILC